MEKIIEQQNNLNIEKEVTKKLEQTEDSTNLQKYLADLFHQNGFEMPKIKILEPDKLPDSYKKQFEAFNDKRLDGIRIVLVPKFWKVSESHADKQLIIFRQEYFEDKKNDDRIQWMSHEIGHCQKFLDSSSTEEHTQQEIYFTNLEIPAFEEIIKYTEISRKELELELNQLLKHDGYRGRIAFLKNILESSTEDMVKIPIHYPNNKVEQHAFQKQFQSAKNRGITRGEILKLLKEHYQDEYDFLFFNRVLDNVYS